MNGLIITFYGILAFGGIAVISVFVTLTVCLVKEILTDAVEEKQFNDKNKGA